MKYFYRLYFGILEAIGLRSCEEYNYCEICDEEIEKNYDATLCDDCYTELYCSDCGRRLETPGDGLCRRCD